MLPNSAAARDVKHLLHGFSKITEQEKDGPAVITHGKGVYVYAEDGSAYLEGVAAMWCASFGFSEQALIDAATEQLHRLPYYHTLAGKSVNPAIDLAERLSRLLPMQDAKIYLALSGSDANDLLVKIAYFFNNATGRPHKKKIIARRNSYHGGTIMAGSLTGIEANHRGFDGPLPGVLHVSDPNYYQNALPGESREAFAERLAQELEDVILAEGPETIAAFFAEPVTGAGGVVIPPAPYYERVAAILKRYDIFFFADEVINGFYRTGKLFGCDTMGIKPDAMTMAKGLTSAYQPLAAVAVSDRIYQGLRTGSDTFGWFGHGQTYSGHPVGCAVALRVLELLEERQIAAHVADVGRTFLRRINNFSAHPLVGDVRAVGLVGAVEFDPVKAATAKEVLGVSPAKAVRDLAERKYKVICRTLSAGEICAFSPPLIITEAEVNEMFDRFGQALDEVTQTIAAARPDVLR